MTEYRKIYHPSPAADTDHYRIAVSAAVVKTLAYFDIFQYPLTKEEIQQFSGLRIPPSLLQELLQELVSQKKIFQLENFFSLQDNPLLIYRRRQGNERAVALLKKAQRIGRFLYQFPFVSAVGISGSLSKNFADQQADIDFFIITKPNRLWIARTLMHLYKKFTFLTGRQHYYCMNYYIDETACSLTDRNIFTAIELKTLLPVCGESAMRHFFDNNQWAESWLPACAWRRQAAIDPRPSFLKRTAEWFFSGSVSDRINSYLHRVTDRRWKRKEAKRQLNGKGVPMGLVTGKHFAKSNAGDFQEKVLVMYERKVAAGIAADIKLQPVISSAT